MDVQRKVGSSQEITVLPGLLKVVECLYELILTEQNKNTKLCFFFLKVLGLFVLFRSVILLGKKRKSASFKVLPKPEIQRTATLSGFPTTHL